MKITSLTILQRVTFALFLREMKTRFGESKIGYLWVVFEPLLHIVVMLIIFDFMSNNMMPQVPFTLFLVTGMIPFFLFRTIISSLMNSAEANKALFAYKPVKPFDTYISRTLLEVLIYSTIFVIILIGLGWLFGFDIMIAHPLELLMNTGLIIVMAFGIGIGCSVLAYKLPLIKLFVKVFLTVLYFISAIMYPLWVLPSKYMEWLLYNPLLHSIELFRESFFSYYPRIDGISMTFPIMVTITTLFLSLWFYQKYKFQLAASS